MIGILVGIILGLGVLVYFVFFHSEGTIDAPTIGSPRSGAPSGQIPGRPRPAHPKSPQRQGDPSPRDAEAQEQARIETDEPFSFEIRGLGTPGRIDRTSTSSFKATKGRQFPVIATARLIGVGGLLIGRSLNPFPRRVTQIGAPPGGGRSGSAPGQGANLLIEPKVETG